MENHSEVAVFTVSNDEDQVKIEFAGGSTVGLSREAARDLSERIKECLAEIG